MGRKRRSGPGTGRRCAAAGCGRLVRPGWVLCASQGRGAYGRELEAAIGRLARQVEQAFGDDREPRLDGRVSEEAAQRRRAAMAAFRRRVERGEYGELFDGPLRAVMAQAAAERGVAEEIGALRVVMARLLTDERLDAETQARNVARVAGMTVRAVKVQEAIAGRSGEPGHGEMGRVMREIEAEREERRLASRAQRMDGWDHAVEPTGADEGMALARVTTPFRIAPSGSWDRWTEPE